MGTFDDFADETNSLALWFDEANEQANGVPAEATGALSTVTVTPPEATAVGLGAVVGSAAGASTTKSRPRPRLAPASATAVGALGGVAVYPPLAHAEGRRAEVPAELAAKRAGWRDALLASRGRRVA